MHKGWFLLTGTEVLERNKAVFSMVFKEESYVEALMFLVGTCGTNV